MTIILRLTRSQQMALTSLVADYMRMDQATEVFIDVSSDVETTPGELLALVSDMKEIEL